MKVLVADSISGRALDVLKAEPTLEVVYLPKKAGAKLADEIQDADALVVERAQRRVAAGVELQLPPIWRARAPASRDGRGLRSPRTRLRSAPPGGRPAAAVRAPLRRAPLWTVASSPATGLQ